MQLRRTGIAVAATALALAISAPVLAQGQPGGGQGRGQGRNMFGARGRQVTLATVPADYLATALKLTANQKDKIAAIQTKLQEDMRALMPAPQPGQGPGQGGGFQMTPELRQKMTDLRTKAVEDINAVLTTDQKKKAPDVLKLLQALAFVNAQPAIVEKLALTDEQKTKLIAVVDDVAKQQRELRNVPQDQRQEKTRAIQTDARGKVEAILTQQQLQAIQEARQNMRNRRNRNGAGAGAGQPAPAPGQ